MLVLFINYNYAQILGRSEDCRASADNNICLAALHALPLIVALAGTQRAMQQGQTVSETGPKPSHHLRSKRNFWHQHDGTAPLGLRRLNSLQIDFGLAAGRHPMQQQRLVTMCLYRRIHVLEYPILSLRGPQGLNVNIAQARLLRNPMNSLLAHSHEPLVSQRRHCTVR